MSDHYAVHAEGNREASSRTPGATPEDWDKALAEAALRSVGRNRNHVVRVNTREGSRIVCTLVEGEITWPRLATPTVDLEAGR